jgi:hypothetical protein
VNDSHLGDLLVYWLGKLVVIGLILFVAVPTALFLAGAALATLVVFWPILLIGFLVYIGLQKD